MLISCPRAKQLWAPSRHSAGWQGKWAEVCWQLCTWHSTAKHRHSPWLLLTPALSCIFPVASYAWPSPQPPQKQLELPVPAVNQHRRSEAQTGGPSASLTATATRKQTLWQCKHLVCLYLHCWSRDSKRFCSQEYVWHLDPTIPCFVS